MLELIVGLGSTVFWVWMVLDCVRNEPDRHIWIWVLVLFNILGAIAYFLFQVIPRGDYLPQYFQRWTRKRELWVAENEARSIGKAYQYNHLGNILMELGMYERAQTAFEQALNQESDNTNALWGAAKVAIAQKKYPQTQALLEKLLKLDPDYKYGDGSLAYAEVLIALKQTQTAQKHLEKHIKNWSHPQGYLLLADILLQANNKQAARERLETMITRIQGSSYFHYKRNRPFLSKARKMLKKLS